MKDWNSCAKRLVKAELVKRGVSNSELADMLNNLGLNETKSSIDCKLSRGTFSAAFMLQVFEAIGCSKVELDGIYVNNVKFNLSN